MPPRATASRRRTILAAAVPAAVAAIFAADARCAPELPETVSLALTTSLLRDSNLFRQPDGETPAGILVESRADTISSVGARLKLDKTLSRQRVVVDVAIQDNTYDRNSRFDHVAGKGSAQWLWEYGRAWSGEARFEHQHRLSGFADLAANVKNLVDLDTALFNAGYRLDPRWRVWGALIRYETENSALTQRQNDTTVATAVIGAEYRSRADNTVGLQLRRSEGMFPHREIVAAQLVDNEYTETNPALTWAWNITAQTRFDGRLGYTVRSHEQFSARDFSGPTFQLHYAGAPTGKLRIDATAWRELWTAESQTSSYVVAGGIRVSPLWAATNKIAVRASAAWETRSYQGDPGVILGTTTLREDTLRTLQLEAIYAPLRSVDVQLLLEKGTRGSNQPQNQYEYESAFVNLRLKF